MSTELTENQKKILQFYRENPEVIVNSIQNSLVDNFILKILKPFISSELNAEQTIKAYQNLDFLKKTLEDENNPFTRSLVLSSEQSLKHIFQNPMNLNTHKNPQPQYFKGRSSHNNFNEQGANKGFTIVYNSNQFFFKKNGKIKNITKETAPNLEPKDVFNPTHHYGN